jgi:hypothetical protein
VVRERATRVVVDDWPDRTAWTPGSLGMTVVDASTANRIVTRPDRAG